MCAFKFLKYLKCFKIELYKTKYSLFYDTATKNKSMFKNQY